MKDKQLKELLSAQQGELDAVPMYRALAKVTAHPSDKETFLRLAKDEGRHASVFHSITGRNLKPSMLKARLLPLLYRILGRRVLYPLIARFEYKAADGYEHLLEEFPEVGSIRDDEKRHGDTLMGLLDRN